MKKRMIKMGERDDYDDPLDIMEDLRFQQTFQKADGIIRERAHSHFLFARSIEKGGE